MDKNERITKNNQRMIMKEKDVVVRKRSRSLVNYAQILKFGVGEKSCRRY